MDRAAQIVGIARITHDHSTLHYLFSPPIPSIKPANRSASCNEFHRCFDEQGMVVWARCSVSKFCFGLIQFSPLQIHPLCDQWTPRGNVLQWLRMNGFPCFERLPPQQGELMPKRQILE